MANAVEKIYSLKTIGFDQIITELDALAKKFDEVKKAKQDYEKQLADNKRRQKEQSEAIRAEKQSIEELKLAELELRKGLKESAIAELELKKAIKEKSNEARAATLARKEEAAQQKASLSGNSAEVNSLKAVRAARAELNAAIIGTRVGAPVEFRGLILPYQQANDTLKKLTEQSNAYSRQFQKDGTLVGEYTTGIIKAFKDMGIDDLVQGQVTRANGQLRNLNDQFEQLKRELQEVKAAGAGSFDNIEKELASVRLTGVNGFDAIETKIRELGNAGSFSLDKIDQVLQEIKATGNGAFAGIERELNEIKATSAGAFNNLERELLENRRAALGLEQQLGTLQNGLRGTGDIGNQITKGLSNGFKEMRGQLGQFILSYVGFQAALQGITTAFNNTIEIEGLNAAMKNVSGTSEELAINQKFLADTAERLGLETIGATSAFKNFYAAGTQAGIGADSVRTIYEAAAQASATLGNSQEQTNGILLAFGQIASKGKVQSEELTGQIGERLPGALAIAARAMGKTQQELLKMMENSQLLANEFLPKFAAELTKTFGGENQGKIDVVGAKVNRLKNIFTETLQSNNAGISALISGVIFAITGLLNVLPYVTAALGLYAVTWGVANAAMIGARISLIASNAAILAGIAADTIATTWKTSLAAATNFLNAAMGRAAVTSGILRTAITLLSGPIGIVLTIIGLLGISMAALGNSASKVVGSLNDMQRANKALNDVTREANLSMVKEVGELKKLYDAATNTSNSLATIKDAKEKLLAQYPDYFKATSAEKLSVEDLKKGYDELTESIRKRAFAQASAKIAAEAQAKVDEVAAAQIKVDTALADSTTRVKGLYGGRLRVIKDLAEEEVKILEAASGGIVKAMKTITGEYTGEVQFFEADTKKVQAALERERLIREKNTKLYDDLAKKYSTPGPEAKITGRTIAAIEKDLADANKNFENATGKEKSDLLIKINKLKQELLDADPRVKQKSGAGRISKEIKDQLAELDKELQQKLTEQQTKIINLQRTDEQGIIQSRKVRSLTNQEEIENINIVRSINIKYLDEKINYLNSRKKLDAAEKLQMATFVKDKADIELKSITQIQEIHNREFTERQTQLRNRLDQEVAAIKEADAKVQIDPSKTATERAQNKLAADTQILTLYVEYNKEIDVLEKTLIQQTTRNSREIVKAQRDASVDVINDRKAVGLARVKDIETEGEAEVTYQNIKYAKIRTSVLENEKLTQRQRESILEQLASSQQITILTAELNTLEKELEEKKELLRQNQINEDEYNKTHLAAITKAGELEAAVRLAARKKIDDAIRSKPQDLQEATTRAASNALNLNSDEEEKAVGEAIAQSFSLATDAMHSYYDAEQQRIKDSLALNLERLDQEEEQVKAKATSQAESEAIDKEYAAKKRAAQKQAGEEIKKSKKAELRIALFTEIANIAVAANAYPFPFSLGIFAAMSALAVGRYSLGVGQINAQQFAFGGEVPKRGGKFGGKKHSQGGTPFQFQGERYEAEVDELAIIRTRNAPARNKIFQIVGTHQQIASQLNVLGGGIAFEPGAKLKRFATGGNLGATLQAPVFIPSSGNNVTNNSNGITESQLNAILSKVDEGISATNGRIDRLQVHVNAREVVKTNDKYTKAANVGTLG